MERNSQPQLHVFATVEEVLHGLANLFVDLAARATAAHGRFSVALSGGGSPKKLYELLASPTYRERVRWEQVYFFFGDERNVPATDAQSNFRMATEALLAPLKIMPGQIFAVNTALSPAEAAAEYTQTIKDFFGEAELRFDLVLLGLGDNSHTASLFPHTAVLHDDTVGAREVFVPELDAHRITLTAPLLNLAHAVALLVYGADKAAAVKHVLRDALNVEEYPAQLIAPRDGELHWFLDEAAAGDLTP
jgi:6-phosphogluconolactonase